MLWDLYCRVVDNHGDLGVCWRLAADLAGRGESVRLWVDDATALAWMAPQGSPGVQVHAWDEAIAGAAPGDVVIEAFGCELPEAVVAALAARQPAPVWINLEYLSAEPYVERSHRLPSPQRNGLTKWFFYPGFTPATGGLLREPGLLQRQACFDGDAWLADHGWPRAPGERVVSLFCYDGAPLPALLEALGDRPTLLLATPGPATTLLQERRHSGALRAVTLPWLTQTDYDRLLWSCDLNLVRGEDSFVRAQWAGRPFVWHIYPQHDAAHRAKLAAFLDRFLAGADAALAGACRTLHDAWNDAVPALVLPEFEAWRAQVLRWRDGLLAQDDLTGQLFRFVAEKR
ncbi:elongation factor P maturation arginine rhamnosyltransferase EarP [Piscinibacter defluvii]|uniref:elongation factor P maturation arginine rhamnosyltransferase EarP n=1 Tax=Piscinibacter defluvii TaxID=1796922 RepID=UPI000FDF63FF|nr:elongation factor P maturation arginine rhamnosyltransferase EarP [Piscinibacter defluvii]